MCSVCIIGLSGHIIISERIKCGVCVLFFVMNRKSLKLNGKANYLACNKSVIWGTHLFTGAYAFTVYSVQYSLGAAYRSS